MSIEEQNEPIKFIEIIQNNKFNDVAGKFRVYKLNAEATTVKLKEANAVIDQLKNEINISRELETSLRKQITSTQERLIYLQKTNTKILTVTEHIRQNEKASLETAQKIGQIEEVIQKLKQESQNLFQSTSKELDLIKKYDELKLTVKNKENEINLLKMENQILCKDKQNLKIETEQRHKTLENDLEQLRREILEMQTRYEQTLELCKKQIEDHELTIKEYERERKSFLEEFAMPKTFEGSADIASADSTVLLIPEDRSPKNSKSIENSIDQEDEGENQSLLNSAYSQGNVSSFKRPKHVSFKPKGSFKHKPQLEFLLSEPAQKTSSEAPPPKRRLFSMNCNHYAT